MVLLLDHRPFTSSFPFLVLVELSLYRGCLEGLSISLSKMTEFWELRPLHFTMGPSLLYLLFYLRSLFVLGRGLSYERYEILGQAGGREWTHVTGAVATSQMF